MIEGIIYECKDCGCEFYDDEETIEGECPKCHVKYRYERVSTYYKER